MPHRGDRPLRTGITPIEATVTCAGHTLDSACHTDFAGITEATGDIIFRNACACWTKLAITNCRFLFSTGSVPTWKTIACGDVPATHSGSAHHTDAHTVASHSDTTATGAELCTLTSAGCANALHVHPSAPAQATQAAIEAQTNEDTYAPPDLIKHSPGVSKGWAFISTGGCLQPPDYNVASVTDTGTGDRTIVWTVDFSTNIYVVTLSVNPTITTCESNQNEIDTFAVGSVRARHYGGTNFITAKDFEGFFDSHGDQA